MRTLCNGRRESKLTYEVGDVLFRSIWNKTAGKIQHVLNRFQSHRELLAKQLSIAQHEGLLRIDHRTKQLSEEHMKILRNSKTQHDQGLLRIDQQTTQLSEEHTEILRSCKLQHDEVRKLKRASEEAETAMRRTTIRTWLGDDQPETRHRDHLKHKHDGTGEWLFKHPQFQAWYNPEHCTDPLLWLHGLPGAGKSSPTQDGKRL